MKKIILLTILAAFTAIVFACGGGSDNSEEAYRPGGGSTPTEAYKNLYAAVKSKDTEQIKAQMTLTTLSFAESVSQQQKAPIEKVLENGFTASTFSPSLPEMRDERIDGKMGAVEVWNAKDNVWHDIPFIHEGGAWRLAIGDEFGGRFKSPGKSRSTREREAANLSGNNQIEMRPPSNMPSGMDANVKPMVPNQGPPPPPPPVNK
ncbi:MAG: hypothetical protein KF685_12765 [Acidobacteria bacterium]|nr:hypothetical protein [Acidobacteriota bacterium]